MKRAANSKVVVIDSCVAIGASRTKSPSSRSRQVLQGIISADHKVCWSKALRKEWTENQANFALQWLSTMVAKKKFIFLKDEDIDQNPALAEGIERKLKKKSEKEAANKDAFLINMALKADRVVFSYDDVARNLFIIVSEGYNEPEKAMWINPKEREDILSVLEDGIPVENKSLLKIT